MFVLALILVPAIELLAFIEVGRAIGWLAAIVLLIVTSLLGAQLLRVQARAAIERVSLAVSGQRAPAGAAIDRALAFLGAVLLVVPGFVTDFLGVLLLLPFIRRLVRRRISRRYAARAMSFAARASRFGPAARARRPADVDATAIEDELDRLDRGDARTD